MAWGDRRYGGDISAVKAQLDHGIEHVWSTRSASLVQLKSGEVVVWGDRSTDEMAAVKAQLDQGIEHVWSTGINFLVQLRVLFFQRLRLCHMLAEETWFGARTYLFE